MISSSMEDMSSPDTRSESSVLPTIILETAHGVEEDKKLADQREKIAPNLFARLVADGKHVEQAARENKSISPDSYDALAGTMHKLIGKNPTGVGGALVEFVSSEKNSPKHTRLPTLRCASDGKWTIAATHGIRPGNDEFAIETVVQRNPDGSYQCVLLGHDQGRTIRDIDAFALKSALVMSEQDVINSSSAPHVKELLYALTSPTLLAPDALKTLLETSKGTNQITSIENKYLASPARLAIEAKYTKEIEAIDVQIASVKKGIEEAKKPSSSPATPPPQAPQPGAEASPSPPTVPPTESVEELERQRKQLEDRKIALEAEKVLKLKEFDSSELGKLFAEVSADIPPSAKSLANLVEGIWKQETGVADKLREQRTKLLSDQTALASSAELEPNNKKYYQDRINKIGEEVKKLDEKIAMTEQFTSDATHFESFFTRLQSGEYDEKTAEKMKHAIETMDVKLIAEIMCDKMDIPTNINDEKNTSITQKLKDFYKKHEDFFNATGFFLMLIFQMAMSARHQRR